MCVFAWCVYKYFIYVIYYNDFVVKTSLQLINRNEEDCESILRIIRL